LIGASGGDITLPQRDPDGANPFFGNAQINDCPPPSNTREITLLAQPNDR
jgi:hypothetical protein